VKQEAIKEQVKKQVKLSSNDLYLKTYLEIEAKYKEYSKQLKELKENLKHEGSYSTQNYIVLVTEGTRKVSPKLEKLVEKYGPSVNDLCTQTKTVTVKVQKKG